MTHDRNIALIGMPGVGKSTVGVLLAKATGRAFLDTDVWIQTREGRTLQDLLDELGLERFCRLEERHVVSLEVTACAIATGGSVVYGESAMRHLRSGGAVVYLRLPLATIERRVTDMDTRGVVIERGQTLADLFRRRRPLYERWADLTVDCRQKTQDQIAAEIVRRLD
jgi:shikimate kinase